MQLYSISPTHLHDIYPVPVILEMPDFQSIEYLGVAIDRIQMNWRDWQSDLIDVAFCSLLPIDRDDNLL